jgi:cytochrome c5
MSSSHEHESPIKTPKQLIAVIVASFLIPIFTIVLLVKYVGSEGKTGAGSSSMTPEAVTARIKPVARVEFKDVNAPKVLKSGQDVYNGVCAGCHNVGAAGAPKNGDKADWSKRLGQGYDTLVTHAIKGIRGMPAKGGNPDLDDIEVARAVAIMGNSVGASFKEPAAPAAPAAPSEAK